MKKNEIGVCLLWGIQIYIFGFFSISNLFVSISTINYILRKYHRPSSLNTHIMLELVGFFLTVVLKLLFKRFSLYGAIVDFFVRLIFLGMVYYDDTHYVRVTVEEKREDEEL